MVVVEAGFHLLIGQLHPITDHLGEANLLAIALRSDRFHLDGLGRRLDRRRHSLGCEIKRDAKDVGILHIKASRIGIEAVVLAAQGPAHHLLTQQLSTESPHAQDMGDRIGVPAFGEHRHRHHTTNIGAELAGLAHRVHHLPQ